MAGSRKLATYRVKRDFTRTAEPRGARKVAPTKRLRYVIQKHAARRLHYDLRLELGGVFKSWAVTKGPSLDPHTRRLAVEVEDHPLDYGDFEGTIPKGQYGGGTVQLWDRGYWAPEGDKSPQEMLRRGDLKFQLNGDRLNGGWVLVRMRDQSTKRHNWLLIKHGDGAPPRGADDRLLAETHSVASGRTMEQIAAGKGRKPKPFMLRSVDTFRADAVWSSDGADTTPTPVHGKSVASMPKFVEPQLCTLVDKPPAGEGWGHEVKLDGYRLQLRVAKGKAALRTRKGLDWSAKFPVIAAAAKRLPDCIIDGELVVLDKNGAPDFAALQAALADEDSDPLIYFAFDLLFADGEDLRALPLSERKQRLQKLLRHARRADTIRYVEHLEADGGAVFESACKIALEGIVSKKLAAPYRSGRGQQWMKSKCHAGHEVIIGGWSETNGRFRSLLVGVRKNDQLVYVGKVGTGYGGATVKKIFPRLKAQKRNASPFTGPKAPRRGAETYWVNPTLVAEIEFAGWTGDGMVRQASFKGLREDKPAAEVQAEDAADATLAAPAPDRGGKAAASKSAVIMGVTISHPEKPLWPKDEAGKPVTKLDLAEYYAAVGPWMIAHLKGRPCSIVRTPDGIGAEHIFQRHAMKGISPLLELTEVRGDKKPYLQVDKVEGLAALAQAAAVELHPWNCAPGRPDQPGRFVFDLDPAPDVGFDRVIAAALELKDRLEALGLIAFCKTTGGKGLHLVTPLAAPKKGNEIGWPEAKEIAKQICMHMAADSPDKYLVNMSKKARAGRIFLDYLRNDRMATAVAVLSPRARDGAPVSMPLVWSQVRKGLDPARFTLRTVPRLLAKTDAWKDYEGTARPLIETLRRLTSTRRISSTSSRR